MSNDPVLRAQNDPHTTEEIEKILATFRPRPGRQLYRWADREGWKGQPETRRQPVGDLFRRRAIRLAGALAVAALLVGFSLFTTWGQSFAQSVFQFFRFAPSASRTEVVSMTPVPSSVPDPDYPFDRYPLTVPQAQDQAGYKIISPESLPAGFTFHGASYDPQSKRAGLLFTLDRGSPSGWAYVSEGLTGFEQGWGVCPSGTIRQVDINGLPAEIANGITWMTDQRPEPGAKREWVCMAGGETFAIRWRAGELWIEITAVQFSDNNLTFTLEEIMDFARSFK